MDDDIDADRDAPGRFRPLSSTVAAGLVVVGLIVVAVGLVTDGGADQVVTVPDPTATAEAPEVLGDRDDRDPGTTEPEPLPTAPTTTAPARDPDEVVEPPGTSVVPTTRSAPAAPPPTAAPAPAPTTTVPTTTTTTPCRQSNRPACGPFRWEPAPTNRPATLSVRVPGVVSVGTPVSLELAMSDPDGPVTLRCYSVRLDRPGLSSGTCLAENVECPIRYGPWSPPPVRPGATTTAVEVRFDESGTYVVEVEVAPPDGCANVDPYRSGATTYVIVEVQDPP